MPRILWRVGILILTSFVLVVVSMTGCESPPPPEGKRVGNLCPEITGTDVDGNLIRLSDYRGQVVLVNFWGTWCRPCRAQIPHEREMIKSKYAGRPFTIIGIAADPPEKLKEFMKVNDLPWPNIADGSPGKIARQWDVEYVPSALLIDPDGVIKQRWLDGMNPDEVWLQVERAVRAAEG